MDNIVNSKQIPAWNQEARGVAQQILDLIKSSKHVLLHCHPSPDGDSLGSTFAMKKVIENMGKKVTAISGDSKLPESFSHLPGFDSITLKNLFEVDLSQIDLFIVQDSGSPEMISKLAPVVFPPSLKVVVIDHHSTNTCFGNVNLVVPSIPANCALLSLIFHEWNVSIDKDIARCLLLGMYTDTGGFKYSGISKEVFEQATLLCSVDPAVSSSFSKDVSIMENSNSIQEILTAGLGLSKKAISVHEIYNKNNEPFRLAISLVSHKDLESLGEIDTDSIHSHIIVGLMRSVKGFDIVVSGIQKNPNIFKFSLRSKSKVDVGAVAKMIGGGGHKEAAGAAISVEDMVGLSDEEVIANVRKKIESAVESYLCKD